MVARSAVAGNPTEGAQTFGIAKPSDCSFTGGVGEAPTAGSTGCTAMYGEGAIAWVDVTFCADQPGWILFCMGDTWTAASGNLMSEFEADQKWVLVQPDNEAMNTAPDDPVAWLRGTYTASTEMNTRCDDTAPTGWRNGGGLYICVKSLRTRTYVAAICNLGQMSGDTPTCANFQTLNGHLITTNPTDPCPRQA